MKLWFSEIYDWWIYSSGGVHVEYMQYVGLAACVGYMYVGLEYVYGIWYTTL